MMAWTYDPEALTAALEHLGFDVEPRDKAFSGAASLTARKDRGAHSIQLNVDAGGRVRVTVTTMAEDQRRAPITAGESEFQVTSRTTRETEASGRLRETSSFATVVEQIVAELADHFTDSAGVNAGRTASRSRDRMA